MVLQQRLIKQTVSRKLTFTVLASTLALTFPVQADQPMPYSQWTVNYGVIDTTTSCAAAGVTCSTLVEDNGFLQQRVTSAAGSFIRMILTEADANGTAATLGFVTENFIPLENKTGYDIHNRQVIRDTLQPFEQIAQIDRSPFFDNNNDLVDLLKVDITQSISTSEANGTMATHFKLLKHEAILPNGEIISGQSIDIQQTLAAATGNEAAGIDMGINMIFDHRQRSGWKLSNIDNRLMTEPFTPADNMSLGGKTVHWNNGEQLTSTWLSQFVNASTIDNTSGYSYQRLENITQSTTADEKTLLAPRSQRRSTGMN